MPKLDRCHIISECMPNHQPQNGDGSSGTKNWIFPHGQNIPIPKLQGLITWAMELVHSG